MGAEYEITLYNPQAQAVLRVQDYLSIELSRSVNDVGAGKLVLPARRLNALGALLGIPDYQLTESLVDWWYVVRRKYGGNWRVLLDTAWQIRRPAKAMDAGGKWYELNAEGANGLLKRRYVMNYAGTAPASKTDLADDMLKEIATQSFVTATVPADLRRVISSAYFNVAGDTGSGPTIDKAFSWRQVLLVMQEIANASLSHDTTPTPLYFDIVPVGLDPLKLEFRTYTGQRGADRGLEGGQMLEFSPERGNLVNPRLEYDYTDEANYVVAGGQGEGTARNLASAEDLARLSRSPWSWSEYFRDATHAETAAQLLDEANSALGEKKPKRIFTADALDAPGSRFGKDWDFGDRVVASWDSEQFDCKLNSVSVKVAAGQDAITAKLVNDG